MDVKVVKFADDTKSGKVITSIKDRDKLQQALDCLCEWAESWGMSFNLSKCKIMHVGLHNPRYEYYMRGTKLGTTEEEWDKGVLVTQNLKPSAQLQPGSRKSHVGPGPAEEKLSLQGQTHLPQAIQAICPPSP